MADDLGVEGITRQRDSVRPEDLTLATTPEAWSDWQKGEVAGSTAEVSNQNQFIMVEACLVEIRRADRFILEEDLFETRVLKGRAQAGEGEFVVLLGLGSCKSHRSPDNGRFSQPPKASFTFLAQRPRKEGEKFLQQ